jgi:hypothetical protein
MKFKANLARQAEAQEDGGRLLLPIIVLGILESLENGRLTPSEAIQGFFNAENCAFVEKSIKNKTARDIMARGVQLPDLFDALPCEEALQEFQREIAKIRELCLELIGEQRLAA